MPFRVIENTLSNVLPIAEVCCDDRATAAA